MFLKNDCAFCITQFTDCKYVVLQIFRRKTHHAFGGSFDSWLHIVIYVCMFSLLGIVRWKFGYWIFATSANAHSCTSNINAADSIKALVHKLFGLALLGLIMVMVLNELSTTLQ